MIRPRPLVAAFAVLVPAAAFADEYAVAQFTGGWIAPPELVSADNPSGSTQILAAKHDDATTAVTLPFEFPFFGKTYTAVSVADDGWLAFGTTNAVVSQNPALRSTVVPNGVAAPAWDSLRTGGKGSIVRFTTGVAPNRTFVVAWQRMDTSDGDTRADISFEVLLHETTGVIEFAYEPDGKWDGLTYTSGIENETGTRAFGAPNLLATNTDEPEGDRRFTPNAVPISGRILRDRPVATTTGLGVTTETGTPVVGAEVAIVPDGGSETIAMARTGDDGSFTVTALGIDGAPSVSVELRAAGIESKVTDTNGATWKHRIASGIVPSGTPSVGTVTIDAAVDTTDPHFRKVLNVQQAARRGFAFATAAANSATSAATKKFPRVEIRWVPGSGAASGYAPGSPTSAARVTISDAPANADAFDDDVVLREYGQHVFASIAVSPGALVNHLWTRTVTPPAPVPAAESDSVALLDGFSFWFAAAVEGRSQFIDTTGPSAATVFDLEGPSPAATGAGSAGPVAAALWDLVDAANEARDEFAGTLPATAYSILLTLDQRKGAETISAATTAQTLRTFFDAWTAKHTEAESRATVRAFVAPLAIPDDTFEPNDRAGEEKAVPQGASRVDSLVLNPFDEDRFTFPVGADPISAAVSWSDAAELELTILDPSMPGSPVVATGLTTESPAVATTPPGLAAGTYVARIRWLSGGTAHYVLGLSAPPVLVTGAFPATTAGQPYNLDLAVSGGVAPLTLSLDPAVPGLALVNGTHLTGRPTQAGVFHVKVLVTDASGSGARVAGERDLVVNPALTLLPVVAVAAGVPANVAVGRGGTMPVWTSSGAAPPAGFTVTPGATLRLTGMGASGAFEIEGSGTDAVGASVPTSKAAVVVAPKLAGAAGTRVSAALPFGFWFDAIEGSTFSAALRFAGHGPRPKFRAILDAAGDPVALARPVAESAGGVRVSGVLLPRTGRYFLVFDASPDFSGSLGALRMRVRPPQRFSGVANIAPADAVAEARFTAIAGSTARIVIRSGRAPVFAKPGPVTVEEPNEGDLLTLPMAKPGDDGRRSTISGVTLGKTGEYVLRYRGDGVSTGPLTFEVLVSPPKGAPFELD